MEQYRETGWESLKSNVPRGSYHENVASHEGHEFSATSWKDNKQVLLLSTYVGVEPADTITRYEKKLKANVQVSRPRVIKEYNAHMGGVDLMDCFIGRYRIRIKSRKWTTRLFYHLLNMSVINAWVLYKKLNTMKGKLQKNIMILELILYVDIKVTRKIKWEDPVPTVDKTLQYHLKDPGQVYKYYPLLTCVAIVLVMKKYLWIL